MERRQALPGKVVPPENWHLTLRFLGSIDSLSYERVLSHVDEAERGGSFRARLGGIGAFPTPRKAGVLWIGVDRGVEELMRLAERAEEAAQAAGLPAEDRPFKAHLTLSRLRPPQDLRPLFDRPEVAPVTFWVRAVTVFRSHLERGGPRYEVLETFPLS